MILTNNSLNFPNIDHISNHAKNYKKNYKICQKNIEKYSDELNITFKNETPSLHLEGKEINKSLKDEIVNWFFSLPLETRVKITTVENCWLISLIHQMYTNYKQNNSSCFEFVKDNPESEIINQNFYFTNINYDFNQEKEMNETNFQNHFITKSVKRDKHDYYLISMFLKEVRFFSVHTTMDCMTLSPKVLDDKSLFLHYFNCFSEQRSFTKIIEVMQDNKTKLYSFAFPKWIEKDLHQITSYISAFLEQAIIIKFILNYNIKSKEKIITSLFDENSFNEIFKLRKEIIFFLNENYPNNQDNDSAAISNNSVINSFTKYSSLNIQQEGFMNSFTSLYPKDENVEKLIKNLDIKKIHQKIMHNTKILTTITNKNNQKGNYKEYYYRKLNSNDPLFEGINDEDTEKKIFKLYLNEDIIVFVDYLIFSKIDSIYQLDFYFGLELLQSIHNLYTDKNALDLIKEFEETNEITNKGKKGKKGKNNKLIELTPKEIEKNNFNYYKPYLNKENIYNYSKQTTENSQINLPCGKIISSNYNTIANESISKEEFSPEKNNKKENINTQKGNENLNISDIDIEIKSEKELWKEENNQIEHIAEIKIICNEIIIEIIDESVKKSGEIPNKNKTSSLNDLIDDIKTINNKSKKLNNLILEENKIDKVIKNHNKNLTIQCAYDIELGQKNQIINNKENTISNNFIIETHQISIENNNKKSLKKNLIEDNQENPKNDENSTSEKEEESSNSNNENEEKVSEIEKIKDKDEDNTTSISDLEVEKNKTGKKKKDMVSYVNETFDNNSEDEDPFNKKKRGKKKVQKFYQVNMEKLNKKKNVNNNNNKNEIKNTSAFTTNKSTQTSKEVNSLNVNLNITSQNLINNNVTNKYEKKNLNTKHIVTNNFNINNNVNINNLKNNSNGNNNRNSASLREYSKYDFPKGNKKAFNKKNENKNIIESPNSNLEKSYSTALGNNNSVMYKSNKDFNQNYAYDSNRNNQYNINLNYDFNYEGNNINNYPVNNSYRYRKRSNNYNWNEKKMLEQNFIRENKGNYNSILSTPSNNSEFLSYVFKLHYDILSFHNSVLEIVNSLKDIKVNVISCIEKYLKKFIDYELSLDVFGSFASELSIESSDIDLKVNIITEDSENIDYEDLIFNLVKKFNMLGIFEFVMPIHTASVPVIKLIVDPTKIIDDDNLLKFEEFKNSEIYNSFKFNKEELNKFKIDLTFLDLIKKQQNNSLGSIDFAKNNVILYAEIRPILFILKRLLLERNLNSAFNGIFNKIKLLNLGGLSSYCLFLLILAYIKFQKYQNFNTNPNQNNISYGCNLGKFLIDFLEYYGKIINFHYFTIDVNQPNPFIFESQFYEKCPIILDPLNFHNVSKSSFRIEEVRECLSKSYDYLIEIKYKYDRKDSDNKRNIIFDLIMNSKKD